MEHQVRVSTNTTIVDIIDRSNTITVDENALCDTLRCLYFLHKNEIPYTTNFKDLKELCVMLGSLTYTSLVILTTSLLKQRMNLQMQLVTVLRKRSCINWKLLLSFLS